MLKKIIAFFCMMVIVVACVGCNGNSDELTITVKKSIVSDEDFEKQKSAIDNFIKAFKEKNPGLVVNVKYVKEYPAELKDTELILLGAEDVLEFAPKDLKILSDYKAAENVNERILDIGRLAIESSEKDLYFVPFNYDRAVVYADKGIFDFLGIEVPNASWTYEDFKNIIKEATDSKIEYEEYSGSVGVHLPFSKTYVWKYFYENIGDGWYNEKHARVNFVGENNLKVMEEVLGLYKKVAKSYVMTNPGTVTDKGITAMAWVNACQPAYDDYRTLSDELNYSLLGRRVDSVAEKGNLVLLPLPAVNGVNMSYANTDFIRGFGISKYINEDKIENAMKLIEFSQTVEGNKALHDYYGGIPSNDALWAEDYWKTGCFSGSNADNVLKGIENDSRDDYADILKGDAAVYEKNVRLRAIAAGYIMQDFRKSTRRIDAFEEIFSSIGRFFNSTIIDYGVPDGYNPAILEKGV